MSVIRNNYQLQATADRIATMKVADLIAALSNFPADMPVVMLSPEYGSFGSEMPYGVSSVDETVMPRMKRVNPAHSYEDDETGETVNVEADTQIWPEWRGIVLQGR